MSKPFDQLFKLVALIGFSAVVATSAQAECTGYTQPGMITVKKDQLYLQETLFGTPAEILDAASKIGLDCVYIRVDEDATWKDLEPVLLPLGERGEFTSKYFPRVGTADRTGILRWEPTR